MYCKRAKKSRLREHGVNAERRCGATAPESIDGEKMRAKCRTTFEAVEVKQYQDMDRQDRGVASEGWYTKKNQKF